MIHTGPLRVPRARNQANEIAVRCLSQLHGYYNGRGDVGRRVAYANALTAVLRCPHHITTIQQAAATPGIGGGSIGIVVVEAARGDVPAKLVELGLVFGE